jgi:hypothetical protein
MEEVIPHCWCGGRILILVKWAGGEALQCEHHIDHLNKTVWVLHCKTLHTWPEEVGKDEDKQPIYEQRVRTSSLILDMSPDYDDVYNSFMLYRNCEPQLYDFAVDAVEKPNFGTGRYRCQM